jgi:WD40 repeat protein
MFVRLATYLVFGTALFLAIMWGTGMLPAIAKDGVDPEPEIRAEVNPSTRAKHDIGAPLYAMAQPAVPQREAFQEPRGIAKDPIVISNAHTGLIMKEEVPSERDGVIRFIGTEVRPEDRAKYPGKVFELHVGPNNAPRYYRPLREGDVVAEGDLIAQVKEDLARAETYSKMAKLKAAEADQTSSEKTKEESYQRWMTQKKLYQSGNRGATSLEDVRGAELTYNRYVYETIGKIEAVKVAQEELNQAKTTLDQYEIRSKISGYIKTIYKKDGEAVTANKSPDPVMLIVNTDRLKVEGQVDLQYASDLRKGMTVIIEPTYREPVKQTFRGHTGQINSVSISKDPKKPYIVSGSEEDMLALVWLRSSIMPVRRYPHPAAVRVVECAPVNGEVNLCVTGDALGQVRFFDLNVEGEKPLFETKERHHKAVTAAAFSPDGKVCATASDDGQIMLWDTLTGNFKYSIVTDGHRTIVTALAFTPQSELISACRDTWLKVWQLGAEGAQLKKSQKRQSVAVGQVGVSPDGKYYMAEHGREMRIMSLATQGTEAILRNPSQLNEFNTLSQFSPDGRLALTCSGAEGLLQVWKLDPERSYEVRQLSSNDHSQTTCADIAPDGSFVVAGNKDGKVFSWDLPPVAELAKDLKGVITSIDETVATPSEPKVQITAEMDNPKDRRLPSGDTVTIVARPGK